MNYIIRIYDEYFNGCEISQVKRSQYNEYHSENGDDFTDEDSNNSEDNVSNNFIDFLTNEDNVNDDVYTKTKELVALDNEEK